MEKVLMVCLGNICRSPMAEGILRKRAEEMGLDIEVDSAGFEKYHYGDPPSKHAIATAKLHNIDISQLKSRTFCFNDFKAFDYIYVMDANNYDDVMNYARSIEDKQKVDFVMNMVYPNQNRIVPDPYGGSMNDFENVFNMLDTACIEICNRLKKA